TASVSGIHIDRTPPTITSGHSGTVNANGWYNTDVAVNFSCGDPPGAAGITPSGIQRCSDAQTLHEGANQSVTGTALDKADNSASTTAGPFNIDEAAPLLSGAVATSPSGTGPDGTTWYSGDVTIHW